MNLPAFPRRAQEVRCLKRNGASGNRHNWALALAALILGYNMTQASAQTASLLRVRGANHSCNNPATDVMTESDIQKLKSFGANELRIHLFYNGSFGSFATAWPAIRAKTVQKVQWCKNQGIKAVICFGFSPWEDQGVAFNSQAMWQRSDLSSTYCQLWQDIVNDLAPNKDAIWGYDLINEPHYADWNVTPPQWKQLAIDEAHAIHAIDPLAWCIYDIGPLPNASTLVPLPVSRVIYNTHFYRPNPFINEDLTVTTPGVGTYKYPSTNSAYTDSLGTATASKSTLQAWLQGIRNFQTTYNVPIYMGEFSASAGSQLPDSANWLADVISICEGWNWSWDYHAFEDAQCWNVELFDTQRKASLLAGFAHNTPPDTDTVTSAVPFVYEVENLNVSAYSCPAAPRILTGDANFSNSAAGMLDSTAIGQYVTYTVPSVTAGTYDIRIGIKKNTTRGIWQLTVGRVGIGSGTAVGAPQDEFGSTQYTELELGNWTCGTSSDKWFQFMITEKSASSTGYGECFDYIKLIPQ